MRRKLLASLFMLPAFVLGLSALGLIPNISVAGDWQIEATFEVPDVGTCDYSGTAQVTQDGTAFSGVAQLFLNDGGEICPAEMSADLTGTVVGDSLEMGVLMGGELGTATFTASLLKAAGPLQGTTMVNTGLFTGATSLWVATPAPAVLTIPVLGPWGTATLVGLLFLSGVFLLMRQRLILG